MRPTLRQLAARGRGGEVAGVLASDVEIIFQQARVLGAVTGLACLKLSPRALRAT